MELSARFKQVVKPGGVYRRAYFAQYADSVDSILATLTASGLLKVVVHGLYYCPQVKEFGEVYPKEHLLLKGFLKSTDFLVVSPNSYNSLGLGLTQLYNFQFVLNKKRGGEFAFLGRTYRFVKHRAYPKKLTQEFLLVDLLNNMKMLAVDEHDLITMVGERFSKFDRKKLVSSAKRFGSLKTRKLVSELSNVPSRLQ